MLKKQGHSNNDDIQIEDDSLEKKIMSTEEDFDSLADDGYNDDIKIEEEESQGDTIKKLREKIKSCQTERGEYLDGWQRSKADFINAKKSFEEERKKYVSFATGNLLEDILPVVDSFDMAFANKKSWESVDKNWRMGVEYIYSQLLTVLEGNGLKQINPLGKPFDPREHTTVDTVSTDKKEDDDCVVEVVQKGYFLHDKVLRPAKVKVFSYKEKE